MKNLACKIRGKLWSIIFEPLNGTWGHCDHDARTISIEENASDKMSLDTICHEVAHARFSYLAEDEINGFGTELAELLWSLRWRVRK